MRSDKRTTKLREGPCLNDCAYVRPPLLTLFAPVSYLASINKGSASHFFSPVRVQNPLGVGRCGILSLFLACFHTLLFFPSLLYPILLHFQLTPVPHSSLSSTRDSSRNRAYKETVANRTLLMEIIMRFRCFKVALVGEIKKVVSIERV